MITITHRNMTRLVLGVLLICVAFLVNAAEKTKNTAPTEILDRIVAVVGDSVITQTQLEERVKQIKEQLMRRGVPSPSQQVLERQVLEQMVDQQLILQMAEQMSVTVTDTQLNQTIDGIASRNKMSLSQLKSAIESQGMDYEEYREQIRKEMIIAQAQRNVIGTQIQITDQEVKNYIAQHDKESGSVPEYHVLDILIPLSETPSPGEVQAAEKKAADIIKELKSGANFEKTAVSESSGQFALQGGDLGWRQTAELPVLFASTIKGMKTGDISPALRAANGFHIIKLAGIRDDNVKRNVKEYDVRQILIKTSPIDTDDKVKDQLLAIRQEIINGANFGEMAKEYSQGPNAFSGGNVGWVAEKIVVGTFADVMTKLKTGQISQPFKSGNGWHIIEVLGTRQKDETTSFREEQVKELLYKRKFEESIQKWVEQLRDTAYIKIMLTPDTANTKTEES